VAAAIFYVVWGLFVILILAYAWPSRGTVYPIVAVFVGVIFALYKFSPNSRQMSYIIFFTAAGFAVYNIAARLFTNWATKFVFPTTFAASTLAFHSTAIQWWAVAILAAFDVPVMVALILWNRYRRAATEAPSQTARPSCC
jgi:hypothetical protein